MWKRLLRDPVRAPDVMSCPEEASASKPAQEGFWFLWDVLSCLSGPGGLSCLVLYCLVCLAPEGSWYPLAAPWEFFWGVEGFRLEWPGRGTRPWPRRPPAMASRAPYTWHGLQSSMHLPWPPELPAPPWPPELPAPHWPPLSVPLWRSPSCVPVHVCPEGPPERPLPLHGGTVTAWDTPSGRGELCQGSVVCVSCVPASCVHIWFVSCPRLMWLLVNSCPAVFMWLCVNYTVYLVPVFLSFISSGLLVTPGVSCLSALPCPAMSSPDELLKTIIWVYVLVCVSLFLPAVCTVTHLHS